MSSIYNSSLTKLTQLSLCVLLLSLTACVSQKHIDTSQNNHWGFSGKFRVKAKENTQNANIIWAQEGDNYTITLFGPLGQGKIIIEKQNQRLTLDQDGQTTEASSPEELLSKTTGWTLPISAMTYWLQNKPSPETQAYITKNQAGLIRKIEQQDWVIDFVTFYDDDLPKKINLERENIVITLIIKAWQA